MEILKGDKSLKCPQIISDGIKFQNFLEDTPGTPSICMLCTHNEAVMPPLFKSLNPPLNNAVLSLLKAVINETVTTNKLFSYTVTIPCATSTVHMYLYL